jgi:hypothetical protein
MTRGLVDVGARFVQGASTVRFAGSDRLGRRFGAATTIGVASPGICAPRAINGGVEGGVRLDLADARIAFRSCAGIRRESITPGRAANRAVVVGYGSVADSSTGHSKMRRRHGNGDSFGAYGKRSSAVILSADMSRSGSADRVTGNTVATSRAN